MRSNACYRSTFFFGLLSLMGVYFYAFIMQPAELCLMSALLSEIAEKQAYRAGCNESRGCVG
jgi:hypothetical protein